MRIWVLVWVLGVVEVVASVAVVSTDGVSMSRRRMRAGRGVGEMTTSAKIASLSSWGRACRRLPGCIGDISRWCEPPDVVVCPTMAENEGFVSLQGISSIGRGAVVKIAVLPKGDIKRKRGKSLSKR